MQTEIAVGIATYNRPEQLMILLSDLEREIPESPIVVWDDASDADYTRVAKWLAYRGHTYHRADTNHGADQHWRLISLIWATWQRQRGCSAFLQIPDDVRLCRKFNTRLSKRWQAANQPASLNILRDHRDNQWTGVLCEDSRGTVRKVGWFDGCGLINREMMEYLSWRLPRITRHNSEAIAGSGAWSHFSRSCCRRRAPMYQTVDSLVVHLPGRSEMHPHRRDLEPIKTSRFIDGIKEEKRLCRDW